MSKGSSVKVESTWDLYQFLARVISGAPVLIQLPDNEPPVQFVAEDIDGTIVLFPLPPVEGMVWEHDTNVIKYGPLTSTTPPPGRRS